MKEFLALDAIFSTQLANNRVFKAQLIDALNRLIQYGAKHSVQQFIQAV